MACRLMVIILTTTGSCHSEVKGKVVLSVFEVGADEGLAAVRGHQSEGEGTWAAMPSFSLGDRSNRIIRFRFPAPTPFSFRSQQARLWKRRERQRCVNDCDSGAAATGKMPVAPVRRQDGGFPS